MLLIDLIAGARPNFMKIAPVIRALDTHAANNGLLKYRLVHTGQHYDQAMSGSFFAELGIPQPDVNLESGSGTQAEQTAAIMTRYEKLLMEAPSDLCLVVGDVTSTMAAAITAQKLHIPVAHVEGGIRSGDWSMPEEINRLLTDSITNWFFTTSETANENLRRIGVDDARIFFVGNTMIDTLLANLNNLKPPTIWSELALQQRNYFMLTLHRPANVDDRSSFLRWVSTICQEAKGLPVVFPVHPRVAKYIESEAELPENLIIVEPQPYLSFNYMVKNALAVITDSGGITEEATVLGVPCLTLRDNTERPETITMGTNELVGTDPGKLAPYMSKILAGQWKKGAIPEKWDGKAAERIVSVLVELLCK